MNPIIKNGFFENRIYPPQKAPGENSGIRSYSTFVGWILKAFGVAVNVHVGGKNYYLNRRSLFKWIRNDNLNAKKDYIPKIKQAFNQNIKKGGEDLSKLLTACRESIKENESSKKPFTNKEESPAPFPEKSSSANPPPKDILLNINKFFPKNRPHQILFYERKGLQGSETTDLNVQLTLDRIREWKEKGKPISFYLMEMDFFTDENVRQSFLSVLKFLTPEEKYSLLREIIDTTAYPFIGSREKFEPFLESDNYPKVVDFLLSDQRVDPSASGKNDILIGALANVTKRTCNIIQKLLRDPRVKGSLLKINERYVSKHLSPPFFTPSEDSLSILKALCDAGMNPAFGYNVAIRQAILENDIKFVKQLLKDDRVSLASHHYGREHEFFDIARRGGVDLGNRVGLLDNALQEYVREAKKHKFNLLREAVNYGCTDIITLLLADKRVNAEMFRDALEVAFDKKHLHITKLLLADGRMNNDLFEQLLNRTIVYVNPEIFELLLGDKRMSHETCGFALATAAAQGKASIVKLLLTDMRVNSDVCNSVILTAADQNHPDIVALLVNDKRVDASVREKVQHWLDEKKSK